jgi:hypothetical protein
MGLEQLTRILSGVAGGVEAGLGVAAPLGAASGAVGGLEGMAHRAQLRTWAGQMIGAVGIHEWWHWEDAEDPWLPRDALRAYYEGAIGLALRARIGRAIERHRQFGQLQDYVREAVAGALGSGRPVPGQLAPVIETALRDARVHDIPWRFDFELRAVVGGVGDIRVRQVTVSSPDTTGAGSWRATLQVSDSYDFDDYLPRGPLLTTRNRFADLLIRGRYREFKEDFLTSLAAAPWDRPRNNTTTVSKPAVVAYFFYACERVGIFHPVAWNTQVTITGGRGPGWLPDGRRTPY